MWSHWLYQRPPFFVCVVFQLMKLFSIVRFPMIIKKKKWIFFLVLFPYAEHPSYLPCRCDTRTFTFSFHRTKWLGRRCCHVRTNSLLIHMDFIPGTLWLHNGDIDTPENEDSIRGKLFSAHPSNGFYLIFHLLLLFVGSFLVGGPLCVSVGQN